MKGFIWSMYVLLVTVTKSIRLRMHFCVSALEHFPTNVIIIASCTFQLFYYQWEKEVLATSLKSLVVELSV